MQLTEKEIRKLILDIGTFIRVINEELEDVHHGKKLIERACREMETVLKFYKDRLEEKK